MGFVKVEVPYFHDVNKAYNKVSVIVYYKLLRM